MHKEKLYEMLCDELDRIVEKGELTAGSLDTIDKLTHSIKSLATIMAMDDYSHDDRYSYRRDALGRYSRRGYSRDDSHKVVDKLERLMDEATDSRTRKAIEKAISQLEQ